jgi:hypothetical protein
MSSTRSTISFRLPGSSFQVAQPRELQEVPQQVLQPGALFLNRLDLGQRTPLLGRVGTGEILGQQSMFMLITDSGFLIS